MSWAEPTAYAIGKLDADCSHTADGKSHWMTLGLTEREGVRYTGPERATLTVFFTEAEADKFRRLADAINEIFGEPAEPHAAESAH